MGISMIRLVTALLLSINNNYYLHIHGALLLSRPVKIKQSIEPFPLPKSAFGVKRVVGCDESKRGRGIPVLSTISEEVTQKQLQKMNIGAELNTDKMIEISISMGRSLDRLLRWMTIILLSLIVVISPLPSSYVANASVEVIKSFSFSSSENAQLKQKRLVDSDAFQRVSLLQKIRTQKQQQKFVESEAFQRLRRERPQTRAMKEKRDLENLQDDRLDMCVERGVFWEQCFMFGNGDTSETMKEDSNGVINNSQDYQLMSPTGALEPGSSGGRSKRNMPPTW